MKQATNKSRIRGLSAIAVLACGMLALTLVAPTGASAQSGPDYLKVTNVASNDNLNIRSGPSPRNRIIAHAPNGAVFRNLGCDTTGDGHWCHVETPDGRVNGYASGKFLSESGAPTSGNSSGNSGVPELHVRQSGEIEIRFASGCTALYNPAGRRINAGSSCSRSQKSSAHDAVERYMREHANSDFHEGGSAPQDVNLDGNGIIIGGGPLRGSVRGHKEGHYVLIITGDGLTCTAALRHVPGTYGSESASTHCTNGAHGSVIISKNGRLATILLTDGTNGWVAF